MNFKLDYMARLFRTIQKKRFESYAIQRIWHRLNNESVQFVTQQYFKREDGGYALADLYLPQINLVVEIDEPQHIQSNNVKADEKRSQQIQMINDAEIKHIRVCKDLKRGQWCTLEEFNQSIDDIVIRIKEKIEEKGNTFIPWTGDDMLSPEYHNKKGYLSVSENEYVKNIDDAARIFNAEAKHKGFLRAAGFDVPNKEGWIVWLPSVNNRLWVNELSDDGQMILEYPQKGNKKISSEEHLNKYINTDQTRITFFREKDALGLNFYKFVGVFKINKEESQKQNKCVWELFDDRYDLPKQTCGE